LRITPGRKARELVIAYILDADTEERVRCSNRLGWHDCTFVLPDESIHPQDSEPVLYQSATKTKNVDVPSGSLEDWRNAIARYCPGNPRLLFAVSCAFAPPLLRLTKELYVVRLRLARPRHYWWRPPSGAAQAMSERGG
jgi:putative DNA primase/helicase